ncbi:hypothetical protein BKA67DRAFT_572487 [Truncatella angustata]|uniref:MINDY deubiquitinase domain-containing protein n=1 Tax=Truncatella angustata TaxID=152316 RepID=A0A9P8UH13_9PEZI|nr:uncharacterized protein BKA67DRAFT_572487 [Truncatella angustata]KAH6651949.1 hypothetical protein BKA67DRAFT_572487 [Truncatella angustata]KAH8205675.1 hypothetical protein TruAng_000169 [Truncatella angustata]
MVTRGPKPDDTPANANAPPTIDIWSPTDSEDSVNVWGDLDSTRPTRNGTNSPVPAPIPHDVPAPLRPGASPKSPSPSPYDTGDDNPWGEVGDETGKPKITLEHTPTVLRPGGKMETNPFKRKPVNNGPKGYNPSTSSPGAVPVPVPVPPTDAFSQLEVVENEQNTNPWEPVIDESTTTAAPAPMPPISNQNTGSDVWGSTYTPKPTTTIPGSSPKPVSLLSEGESPAWDEVESAKPSLGPMPGRSTEANEFSQDAHAWDDLATLDKGKAPAASQPQGHTNIPDGWNLIDKDPSPVAPSLSRKSTWENFDDNDDQPKDDTSKAPVVPTTNTPEAEASEEPPALPPRRSLDPPPPQPPRPSTPSAANKTETYQIKNIHWFDANVSQNPRRSPILVQNANGPCPLVALVNALTLTTPADLSNTVLVETLRSREQISLNLLLEAVFDELMSPRRTQSDAALPDVTELYAFLKGLHTGMNVNPRYVPTQELITAHKRTSTHQHPSERGDFIPGTFEDTRDMRLYATFSIPLIHGWLPPKEDPAYEAFARQAASYDDAQNLMFREEELEDKLSTSGAGLTEQEQQIYQDIITIRGWLNSSATQLTQWGLQVITKGIQPGTFAILFRNDHFSTLYRHPQTQQLFTLVTDAGYYTHDEIVWESLVDVNGERTEFFSGDFRLVGGPQQEAPRDVPGAWYTDEDSSAHGGQWQAVQNRRGRTSNSEPEPPASPMSANHEQEDRDLALALQLQEEEDERHRNEQAARERESQLSEHFIEQQGRGTTARTGPRGRGGGRGGLIPARASSTSINAPVRTSSTSINVPVRGGSTTARGGRPVQQVRPLVPPANTTHRPANAADDDAPPSYEQASKDELYVPPSGHPNHSSSSPGGATDARRRPTLPGSGPSQPVTAQAGPSTPIGMGRGRPVIGHQQSASAGRDKDCAVM